MILEVKIPSPGESINQVQLAKWFVENGELVEKDQEIAEIDSDKATLSITAEKAGKIHIKVKSGKTVDIDTVIAIIDTSIEEIVKKKNKVGFNKNEQIKKEIHLTGESNSPRISPLAKKLIQYNKIGNTELLNFNTTARITKKDVESFLKKNIQKEKSSWGGTRNTFRSKMSTLRIKLSQRMVFVKNETAMLTTFNEVNMASIIKIRTQYQDKFREKHKVKLGYMSFFTKAVTESLQYFPQINSMIDNDEIVSHDYADIGIAVSTLKGLVVPIIRNAETKSMAEIEHEIKMLAEKAQNNKITLDEMKGGTFTITNGGIFGSMLSTPIINPPQSAILGMHKIVDRPVALNKEIKIQPMMYVALSYDHRIIDGKESVGFLVKIKEFLENPAHMVFSKNKSITELLDL